MRKHSAKFALLLLCLLCFLPQSVRAEDPAWKTGDRVLLTLSGESVALSGKAGVLGLLGESFDPENPAESLVWTLEQTESGWILKHQEGRLSLDGETMGLTLSGIHDRWQITESDGTVTLKNTESGWVLTWYPAQEIFEVAPAESAFSQFCLIRLEEEPVETTTETTQETTSETTTETTAETTTETTTETTAAPDPSDPPATPESPDMDGWNLYFGQLHAHTADSDGMGTVAEAFAQAATAGLDFFAVTDHSDSFDNDKVGSLTDAGVSEIWISGKAAAAAATKEDFVALYGFEMSWNQGQGHISTFNTPGFLSRDQEAYEKYKDGMEAYFGALLEVPGSVSQFNHPGTVYGDFKAFSGYSPELDPVISLIEVGSGAGTEYQTAYDAYIQALDKGWHLAPTNNHNNHEGQFGLADTARTVILAKELTEESLYEAMKARRVYATEDADLGIYYTLDGAVMGSLLRGSQVGERAELTVKLFDPTDAALGTVEVIGPGGQVAASAEAAATLSFSLPIADYYFIRITQPDGDIAVTAPVWIRQADNIGISDFRPATDLTRQGEEQTILLTIFNQEGENLKINSITLQEGDKTIATAGEALLAGYSTKEFTFSHTFESDGVKQLRVTVLAEFAGEEREFTKELTIPVLPVAVTSQILLDGIHGQGGGYEAFLGLAASQNISARIETEEISAEQLNACSLLVIPAPEQSFEPEFLELVKNYVNSGGNLLLLGKAGGSEELNCLLETLGSQLRLQANTLRDEVSNDGDPTHVYTADIAPSDLTEGILEGQIFAYSGCGVTGGQWMARSAGGDQLLAMEGKLLLSGGDFLADGYLRKPDHPWALPYANRTIAENLLGITRTPPEIAPMEEVRKGHVGSIYLVEGLVTAGTHNVNTDFPGSIYVQDSTGALEARGYSTHGLELGRRVRILGCLGEEGGRPVLDILQIQVLEKETPIAPEKTGNALDYETKGDRLLQIQGTVTEVDGGHGARSIEIRSFVLRDEAGREARVWVEEFILSGSLGYNHLGSIVKEGNRVSAVGLCHLVDGKPVLRLRDCDEVTLLWEPPAPTTESATEATTEPTTESTTAPATEPPSESTTVPATEVTAESTKKPAPPAYPDNPATGDRVSPSGLLLAMAMSVILIGLIIKKGCP